MQMRRGPDLLIKLSWVVSPVIVGYNFLPIQRISESPSFNDVINSSLNEVIHDVIILESAYSKFVFLTASPPLFSIFSLCFSCSVFLPWAHWQSLHLLLRFWCCRCRRRHTPRTCPLAAVLGYSRSLCNISCAAGARTCHTPFRSSQPRPPLWYRFAYFALGPYPLMLA